MTGSLVGIADLKPGNIVVGLDNGHGERIPVCGVVADVRRNPWAIVFDVAGNERHVAAGPDWQLHVTAMPAAAAQNLLDLARAHHWRTLVAPGVDTGSSPFISVDMARDKPFAYYRITWHTRDTGTYRLFSKICRTDRHMWQDAPSLKAIRAVIAGQVEP